jgi:hypothetical protein
MFFPVYGREAPNMGAGVVGDCAPYPSAAIINPDEFHLQFWSTP